MFIYSSFIFIFVPLQLVLSIPMWNSCTVKNNEDIHISKCQQLFPKLKWKISFACYSLVVHHARLVAPCHFHHSFSLKYADGFLPNLKDGNEDKWIFLYTMGEGKHLSFENAERALKKKTTKSVKWNANANQYTIAKISACSRSQCLCCFSLHGILYTAQFVAWNEKMYKQWQIIKKCTFRISCLFRRKIKNKKSEWRKIMTITMLSKLLTQITTDRHTHTHTHGEREK